MIDFPLEKVILEVSGITTEVDTENNLFYMGFEFHINKKQINATIWYSPIISNNYVLLYDNNTYESFKTNDNKTCVGINNERVVLRTEGSYDTMPTELKEQVINLSFKDKIIGWYEENNNLILNILGDTDVR
jgi:hypothetical protein